MSKRCPHCGQTMPKQVRFRRATVRRLRAISACVSVTYGHPEDEALIAWGFAVSGEGVIRVTRAGQLFLAGSGRRVANIASMIDGVLKPTGRSRVRGVYELMGAAYDDPITPVGEPVGPRADAPSST